MVKVLEYLTNTTNEFCLNYSEWRKIYHGYFKRECEIIFYTSLGTSLGIITTNDETLAPYLLIPSIFFTVDILVRAIRSEDRGRQPVSGLIGILRQLYSQH